MICDLIFEKWEIDQINQGYDVEFTNPNLPRNIMSGVIYAPYIPLYITNYIDKDDCEITKIK